MRVIWSFWSKPFIAHHHRVWASERHHLFAWVLSTQTAMRHYRPSVLYTDDAGARMLVDGVGLDFDEVHTSLNVLDRHNPEWWALGKLSAYRAQTEPFVHIDNDVFLWQPLPYDVTAAPIFAQNPEYFVLGRSYYRPDVFEEAMSHAQEAWLPPEWLWYRTSRRGDRAECCGVLGGNRVDFIQHYAAQAIRLLEDSGNQPAWAKLSDKIGHNVLFEQYLLAACIDYHQAQADSPFCDIAIKYLFSSINDAFNPETASHLGYTHLIADAKRNPELARRLEARVAKDHPLYYERCLEYMDGHRHPAEGRPGIA